MHFLITMQSLIPLIIIFDLVIGMNCDKVTYDNCRVYSIHPENEKQLKYLQKIEIDEQDLIFLTAPLSTRFPTDVVVPPHKFGYINEMIAEYGLKNEIKTENLQR